MVYIKQSFGQNLLEYEGQIYDSIEYKVHLITIICTCQWFSMIGMVIFHNFPFLLWIFFFYHPRFVSIAVC